VKRATSDFRGYVGVTDRQWFERLRVAGVDEVNFWQPSPTGITATPGTPWIFKLHYPENAIVGFGFLTYHTRMPIAVAWDTFGIGNGVTSISEMVVRVSKYRKGIVTDAEEVGCIVLSDPVFLDEVDWIQAPDDWAPNIVKGKYYDLAIGPAAAIWHRLAAYAAPSPASPMIFANALGKPALVVPRLGQGAFRLKVTDAYGRRCAVTGERTLPTLDAAHIRPFADVKAHDVRNGLLLRSDVHRLFDLGYVTVRPDLRFAVSQAIRRDFENGRDYYALDNTEIRLPSDRGQAPALDSLEWHNDVIFRG
jgi:putative restriction endonuclease